MEMHYQKHIFICTNQKEEGKVCCANGGASDLKDYFKKKLVEAKLHGPDKYRISSSGCLGRCKLGPCIVIYPEGTWYSYQSKDDIDTIIANHLIIGEKVNELEIKK